MVPAVLDEISPALKSRAEGTTKIAQIREVLTDIRTEDDGRWTIVLTFLLADPPKGMETWPVEELWELRRVAREVVPQSISKNLQELANERDIDVDDLPPISWTVEFKPEHMPPVAPADEQLEFEG
jgi:hypothetical protein